HLLNRYERAVKGSKVLLLGLTYKAGTSDWRESPAIAVAERLGALGAKLVACDPHLPDVGLTGLELPLVPFTPESLAAADLVLLLVDHPEFDAQTVAEHSKVVFDTRGVLRDVTF